MPNKPEESLFIVPDFGSSPAEYFRNVKLELAKVEWPNRQYVYKATILVFVVSIIVGAFLGGLDLGFTKLFGILLQ